MVVMMMVMVMMVRSSHHLRLRRDRSCEVEDEEESDQKPFHIELDGILSSRDYRDCPGPASLPSC
jgi:hypothetical protein